MVPMYKSIRNKNGVSVVTDNASNTHLFTNSDDIPVMEKTSTIMMKSRGFFTPHFSFKYLIIRKCIFS